MTEEATPPNRNEPHRILIVRGGALGDFVLTLPVFRALRTAWPKAEIDGLTARSYGRLAVEGGLMRAWRCLDDPCWAEFFVPDGELDTAAAAWLGQFDRVISFLHDPKNVWRKNVARCVEGSFLQGIHRPVDTHGVPASKVLMGALSEWGLDEVDPVPVFSLGGVPNGKVAFHPGSGSVEKNWPEANWVEWARRWLERGRTPLLMVAGEAERDRVGRMVQAINHDQLEVLVDAPIETVGRRLEGCVGFVGHDSGVTHLAAALGVPCLALWGPSCEVVWRPLNEQVSVLKSSRGLMGITVDEVLAATGKMVPCH